MNNNWQTKKLGEIFLIERGGSPRPIESFLTGGVNGINWIKIGDTKNVTKYIYTTKQKIKPEGLKKSRLVQEDDFILSNSMSFGRPYIMKTSGAIHDGWLVLRKKMPNIDNNFFYYLLSSPLIFTQFDKLAAGSTVRNLNTKLVSNVSVSLPSLPEQHRIVKILDEAFENIEKAKTNAEKNLANARELFESYLQNVFSNPRKERGKNKLERVCDFYNGKAHEKCIDKDGKYIVINSKFISSNGREYKKTNKALYPLFCGDIVMVMSDVPNGKALAKCFIVDKENIYTLNQRICVLRAKRDEIKFLYYQINRNPYLLSFDNGENQTNLRKNDILNCPLLIPTISEQRTIVKRLDTLAEETKKLEAIYKQKLADLEELKKSVLKKAFAGELK